MQAPPLRSRYRRIMAFFLRLTLSVAFWDILLPNVGARRLSRSTRSQRYKRIAADFRRMAIRLGGVMIKVGQFLSARLDVLPAEITEELSGLQDEVPPEDFGDIQALAETELGARLETLFEAFDAEPLAAASLGQVHRARLHADAPEAAHFRDVVVKIQRPNIAQLIDVDFSALRRVGGWLHHYGPIRKRVNVPQLIEELSDSVYREIDYLAEGGNAERFAANFAARPRVRVPRIVWSRTTVRVLTLEDVYAIKITDYDAISAAGIDRAEVAAILFDTYLKQIFEDYFFHADPHPGNLFVSPVAATSKRKVTWKLTFVDFGMAGIVPEHLRLGMRDMVIGIATRDARKLVASYQTLGVLLPGADVELLEKAEAQLFDRFWGMSMSELRKMPRDDMRRFAHQFRDLMFAMPFQVPQNLLLLGRSLAILSGMCTGLDPEFNVWKHLAPYAKTLVAAEGQSTWDVLLDQLGDLAKELLALPAQTGRILTRMERGELNVNAPHVSRQMYHLETAVNRLLGGVLVAAFLFAGALLYHGGDRSLSYVFWGGSGLSLLWTVFLARGHPPPNT